MNRTTRLWAGTIREAGFTKTKVKDGHTYLAYNAERAMDLETGAVVAVTMVTCDAGNTETILETLPGASEHIAEIACAQALR